MPIIVRAHLEAMRQRGLAEWSTIYMRRRILARLAQEIVVPACEATREQLAEW